VFFMFNWSFHIKFSSFQFNKMSAFCVLLPRTLDATILSLRYHQVATVPVLFPSLALFIQHKDLWLHIRIHRQACSSLFWQQLPAQLRISPSKWSEEPPYLLSILYRTLLPWDRSSRQVLK
jgi:hypothetical protein